MWIVVFALVVSWADNIDSGWDEVKALKLSIVTRIRLIIPFSEKWKAMFL